jgi:DNA-binding HxlR family transcriptional regulator
LRDYQWHASRGNSRTAVASRIVAGVTTLARRVRSSSVSRALDLVGDRWTLLVLREAFLGVHRFEAFRHGTGAPRGTLANRLARLVQDGILVREDGRGAHGRHEYHLAVKGLALHPVSLMIWRWERRFAPIGSAVPGRLVHVGCGRSFAPRLCCAACGGEVRMGNTTFRDAAPRVQAAAARASDRSRTPLTRRSGVRAGRAGTRRALAHAIDLLGDRWTAQLIAAQFFGLHRFDEMRSELGIAPNVLSGRLAWLVSQGVLRRRRWQSRPPRDEYRLTPKGEATFPFTVALLQWADRWLAGATGPPLILYHRNCGRRLQARVRCSRCDAAVGPRDVRYAGR